MNPILQASPDTSPSSAQQRVHGSARIRAAKPFGLLCLLVLGASSSASAAGEVALVTGMSTRLMLAGTSALTPPPAPPDLGPETSPVVEVSSVSLQGTRSWMAEDDRALQARLTGLRLELESLPKPGPSGLFVGGLVLTLTSAGVGLVGLPVVLLGVITSLTGGVGLLTAGTIMIAAGLIGIPVGAILLLVGGVGQDQEKRRFEARVSTLKTEYEAIAAELQRRSGAPQMVAPAIPGV